MLAANKVLSARALAHNEIDEIRSGNDGLIEKFIKLKNRKSSKTQQLAKSRKLSKLGKSKKLSKNRNSLKFNAEEDEPSFLTPKARTAFNCLWLTFIKALIL